MPDSITIPEGDFYSTNPEQEELTATEPEEALQEWSDALPYQAGTGPGDGPGDTDEIRAIRAHAPVTLHVWRREVVSQDFIDECAAYLIERVTENYDEDFGPPAGTEWGKDAAAAAHKAITDALRTLFASEPVWRCDVVGEVTLSAKQVIELLHLTENA